MEIHIAPTVLPLSSSELTTAAPDYRYHFLLPPPPRNPSDRMVTFNVDHVWSRPDIVDFLIRLFHPYGTVCSIRPFY